MRRGESWIRVPLLLAIGVYGTWTAIPFFAILGYGFAAAALVPGRQRQALLAALTFAGLGSAVLVEAARGPLDAWAAFRLVGGLWLSGMAVFLLWRLRQQLG